MEFGKDTSLEFFPNTKFITVRFFNDNTAGDFKLFDDIRINREITADSITAGTLEGLTVQTEDATGSAAMIYPSDNIFTSPDTFSS